MYLLDTNVVSELRKPRPHGGVLAWLRSVDDKALFLSAVTVGEIQAGIELTREQDAATFRVWARLMHRRSDTLIEDAMIAATASVRGLSVVTRNVADFKPFSVPVLNPFNTASG
jgi:toxin FitB